jgi:hypothetical protein
LVHFSPFWYFVPRKIWQPCLRPLERSLLDDFSAGVVAYAVTAVEPRVLELTSDRK